MKHSRSGSFESNGYAEPQKQTLLGDPLKWPSPSSWTVPSRAYEYRTVSFNFSDPRVPQILQHPIQVCCHIAHQGYSEPSSQDTPVSLQTGILSSKE